MMLDQIAGLERQLLAMENEKKQLLVGFREEFERKKMIDVLVGESGSFQI